MAHFLMTTRGRHQKSRPGLDSLKQGVVYGDVTRVQSDQNIHRTGRLPLAAAPGDKVEAEKPSSRAAVFAFSTSSGWTYTPVTTASHPRC